MRRLFAALTRSAFADRVSFSGNVLGKYPNYRSTNCRLFVEKLRGSLFDLFSQSEKLLRTRAAFCSLRSREFIKRGIADLTDDNLVVVQHEKPESVSFVVMPLDFVTDQRHGHHSTQTDTGSPRLPRPASLINGLTATLSRKLLTFFFALAVTVAVSVGAFGQMSLTGAGGTKMRAPAGPSYTFVGASDFSTTSNTTVANYTIAMPGNGGRRRVAVGSQNFAVTSVVYDPTGANVSLTQDYAPGVGGFFFSGTVPSASGTKTVQVTYASNIAFNGEAFAAWVATGLTSGFDAASNGGSSTIFTVNSGDLLFSFGFVFAGGVASSWGSSTSPPSGNRLSTVTGSASQFSASADWTSPAPGSFSIVWSSGVGGQTLLAVTYR